MAESRYPNQTLQGSALFSEKLKDESFPLSKKEVIERYGDLQIQLMVGCGKSVRELLERSDKREFEKPADVIVSMLEPLHPVLLECDPREKIK